MKSLWYWHKNGKIHQQNKYRTRFQKQASVFFNVIDDTRNMSIYWEKNGILTYGTGTTNFPSGRKESWTLFYHIKNKFQMEEGAKHKHY